MQRILRLLAITLGVLAGSISAHAQSIPTLQAFQATGLSMPYTAGTVTVGGTQLSIPLGAVVLTDNQTSCTAPQFMACNFVYWNGINTSLSVTTSPSLAFAAGNAILGFVTTNGGVIQAVTYFSQAGNMSDNLIPAGVTLGGPGGIRQPVCNALTTRTYTLYSGCQLPTGSLSGY